MKHPAAASLIALVVVADPVKSSAIKKALKGTFSLFEIEDSFSAVDWLKHFQASLIILEEDALTKTWPLLVQHIRKLPGYSHIPILLISGKLGKAFSTQALSHGITDFLLSPLDPDEIYRRVLVNLRSSPVHKRISLLTKKIARPLARKYPPSLPQRFLVTEEVIKQASLSHTPHMPQVLIMIEIDRFQEMQEVYSEDTLAQMLDTVSSLLQSLVRKQDFLLPQAKARYLLILPRTSQRAAIAMAETIRKEVEAQTFPAEPFPIPITLSLGLIAFDADPKRSIYDQFDAFLGKVDRALAKAKEKGNTLIAIKKRDSS